MYVRGLVTEPTVPADRMMAAMDMVTEGTVKAFKDEGAAAEKSLTLLKRTKQGSGCDEGKGMEKTCAAIAKIPDLKSNSFGETRVIIVKAGKEQPLESCTTNANVAILLAAKEGVTVTVAGTTTNLVVGLPIVVDYCQVVTLSAPAQAAVLFAQAWHPEFAAVERTTELRARAKTFSLSEDEVKEAVKIVNDHSKKSWEKSAKQWRNESPFIESMKASLQSGVEATKKEANAAEEAKRKYDEDNDEERKKNVEALQKKREATQKAKEAKEARIEARHKQLEEERANRDPWLNDPTVLEAEKQLADYKEQRRDASAKLEFDLTSELTKEISKAERELKKVTKVARKAFKKGGGKVPEPAKAKEEAKEETKEESVGGSADKSAEIKKKLEDVKKKKAAAAEEENFGEAKKLKAVQKDLEEQLKKLEL